MMKIIAACMIALFLVMGGVIIVRLWREGNALSVDAVAANAVLLKDQWIEHNLSSTLDYFSHPENVAKELRARFNLHFPGERTIIVVSPASSSTVLP